MYESANSLLCKSVGHKGTQIQFQMFKFCKWQIQQEVVMESACGRIELPLPSSHRTLQTGKLLQRAGHFLLALTQWLADSPMSSWSYSSCTHSILSVDSLCFSKKQPNSSGTLNKSGTAPSVWTQKQCISFPCELEWAVHL